ncbi:MAG: MmcB family DNA repair protein [Albidovulum sp.]|nr:MmcB family DNA repair protein [Albidovulum sp.]
MAAKLQPGQAIARGVCRHLLQHGFASLEEFTPAPGLRVDAMALGPKGEIWIIECKSSLTDFRTDTKWQGYLDFCDRFFWAVTTFFPLELLPSDTGIIVADAYGAEIVRMAAESKLAAARRKKLTLKFARNAAERLHSIKES